MILVTGGTGLVGAHLLLKLSEDDSKIRAIYRNSKQIEKTKLLFDQNSKKHLFSKIEWLKADILDISSLETAFKNIEFVYHCAAKISFNPNDEKELRKINIEGTANIVNFCIDKNVKKLCHVSSIATLGNLLQNNPSQKDELATQTKITETTEWNPEKLHSDYGISKYGAEMEVWRGFQEGLQIIIVNPGIIFGSGFWNQGSGKFFTSIKKGISFYTKGSTGYVCVKDVVNIMQILMKSELSGERFILVSENRTYKDIIYTIADKINAKKPVIEATSCLLNVAWRLDWILSKIIRTDRKIGKYAAQSLLNKDVIENSKIKKTLNYEFSSIDKCLDEVAADFKKNYK